MADLSAPAIARAREARRASCDLRDNSRRLQGELAARRIELQGEWDRTVELRVRCSTWPSWGLPDRELARVLVAV